MVGKEMMESLCGKIALENFPAATIIHKVNVEYKRYYKFPCQDEDALSLSTKRDTDDEMEVSNFGGSTRVTLRIAGLNYEGTSKCSRLDNFNKKKGLQLATIRAFRRYRDKQKQFQQVALKE